MFKRKSKKEAEKLKKTIEESGFFDKVYYLRFNQDARLANLPPLEHYCQIGIIENRKPNQDFDPVWYMEYYTDIKEDGIYPFLHYVLHGKEEGRFQNENELLENECKSS